MSATRNFYEQHAHTLCEQYNALDFQSVHRSWQPYWPHQGDRVLDVGAGSGRDAKWMAEQECEVIALEPCQALRDAGREYTGASVNWLDDSLPALSKTENLGMRFDLILVSAVWMHLAPSHRERAFRKLSNLLASNGRLVITLRHGGFDDGRQDYGVSVDEIEQFAKNSALLVKHISNSTDSLNRGEVHWQTVVLSLPDDGSGDLNRVRHIIVNDSKSATYKLALLRTLLRIADAHAGAVIDRSDGKVAIPAGLVALYWMRQFKRLIDIDIEGCGGIQQNSNTSKGLGFVKEDGWQQLRHLAADDLTVGAMFLSDDAKALQKALTHALATIKSGPVTFIYQGDKTNRLFDIQSPSQRRKTLSSFVIDTDFLTSYGSFVLDESLWECFRLYNAWIEPLVVNQWILEMQRFELNKARNIDLQTYHNCLVWIDEKHDTADIRKRVAQLQREHIDLHSVWSGSKLKDEYHIDHCLPFAYWPNNDKWNLLPTTAKENLNKKDRVPTAYRLQASKSRILDWWQLAWGEEVQQNRFFSEAAMSLPNIPPQCHDFEQVFEAMGLQVRGVKSRLLVGEW
ncbi:SAM-dependent methyltransferase [Photobacterium jeanii]|uniref:SAM-dependent methyltransferase n=1 Tax=Photobacterium jeanii TaxID=858640 RepID=A0A178KA45_9GAMM|nr:class I SAM-dependent methyltransferase [Photobacterium jeanii]OAN14219.1 SAM-dependent methyltransferase [Photobacterium jeanii]PST89740.1 methyltransferase domain-containing protein [Photobacterium jeanii]